MREALLIAGAILVHAGWTAPDAKYDSDVGLPIFIGLCFWVWAFLLWSFS